MGPKTKQFIEWSSDFGIEYTDRNPQSAIATEQLYQRLYRVSRTELNQQFLGNFSRSLRILEVGANQGNQLQLLQQLGFSSLYGIDIQHYAVDLAVSGNSSFNIILGSALEIPFKDDAFDLVFTSGLLIHIAPEDLRQCMAELVRCSRRYIWGFEYFAEQSTEVRYRDREGLLWKNDYARAYLETFTELELLKEERIVYREGNNQDSMFLLQKQTGFCDSGKRR